MSEAGHASLSRRHFLCVVGAGAGASYLAACAPAGTAPAASAPASLQPKRGGTLQLGRLDDLTGVDPHNAGGAGAVFGVTYGTVYERLIDYDGDLKPIPVLAEGWEFSADAKQVKVSLRKGVTFHTGKEMSSEDVRYSILRVRDDPKANGGGYAGFTKPIQSIELPDKSTLVVKLGEARAQLLDFLGRTNIADSVTLAGPDATKRPVGTGAFAWDEWKQGQYVRVKRNPSYWQSGMPYLDGVEFQIIPDAASMSVGLESGRVDAITDVPTEEFARLKADSRYSSLVVYPGFNVLQVNPKNGGPLANKKVRQALNMAVDRKRFVTTFMKGLIDEWNLPWPKYSEAYEPAKLAVSAFDLDKARATLVSQGVTALETELIVRPRDVELVSFAQMYQADLAKIGVKLAVRSVETAVFGSLISPTRTYPGLAVGGGQNAQLLPSSTFLGGGDLWQVEPAARAQLAIEPDPANRKQLLSKLNDAILDEALDMVVGATIRPLVFATKVHGFARTPTNFTLFTGVWLA